VRKVLLIHYNLIYFPHHQKPNSALPFTSISPSIKGITTSSKSQTYKYTETSTTLSLSFFLFLFECLCPLKILSHCSQFSTILVFFSPFVFFFPFSFEVLLYCSIQLVFDGGDGGVSHDRDEGRDKAGAQVVRRREGFHPRARNQGSTIWPLGVKLITPVVSKSSLRISFHHEFKTYEH